MTPPLDARLRVRFAPSPTGALHVGGARTALFNWLLARRHGGKFILRVEDTDRERSTPDSVRVILDGLRWLGLDWDEGPYFQSERAALYASLLDDLLARGKAYRCFCPEARLETLRETARRRSVPYVYDGRCRGLSQAEAARRAEAGEPHVLRFKVEGEAVTSFDDLVGGPRRFENALLGDFVLRRTDGWPVYHLTVVVDDHEMGITHVLRGDDHLSNTPRQLLIFDAMGWVPPLYGHIPLIQGPDRTRLSKRHGATSLLEFAREGFLPEAMFNYLALLGWSLDAETEILSREELIAAFSLERLNRSAAIFDPTKLEWMNGLYMRRLPLDELARRARAHCLQTGVPEAELEEPRFMSLVALEAERSRTLGQMRRNLAYFFTETVDAYEPKGVEKHFAADGVGRTLQQVRWVLAETEPWTADRLEAGLRGLAEAEGVAFGGIVHPLRLALTGRTASPGIFDVILGLGRQRCLKRIDGAVGWIEARRAALKSTP